MSALLLLLLLLPVLGLALMQHSAVALQSSYGSVARQHWYRTTVATFLSYRNSQMASRTAHDKNSPVALQQHRIYGHSISAHSSLLDNGSPERVDPAERGSGLLAKVTAKLRSWKESIRTGIRSTAGVLANSTANTTISNAHPSFRRLIASTLQVLVLVLAISKGSTASVGFTPKPADPAAIADSAPPLQRIGIWLVLFLLSATMHSAESAITKISPWKVQEFADEEGPKSPFATLSKNLTSLLITILITTTACSIYSTAMFIAAVSELFPKLSLGFVTAALTVITLFFGELLPKALAVSNSELVARKFVPIISRLSQLLLPLTTTITYLSNLILQLAGLRSVEERNVSEDMLRMVVEEAQRTASIESGEGKMIKAVLDMQKKDVSKIMQPRVEIVALPETAVATEILQTAVRTNYSRIPVYRGDVDNIVGVIFTKDLLDYMNLPVEDVAATISELQSFRPQMKEDWSSLLASDLMKPTYFIPEGMSCSNALQELKKRRVHMAIVVDEYGGTAGLVTFEDILEEVVGEIYDEDDDEDQAYDYQTIYQRENGFYELKGYAELDDVYEALGIELEDGEEPQGDYSTIGGLLCSLVGHIPQMGEQIRFGGFNFTILEVEDNRRVVLISAKRRSAQKGQKSDQMRDSNVSDQNGGSDDREGPNEDRYSGEEDENSTNDLAKDNIDPTGKDTVNSEHAVDHSYDARSDWSSDRTTEDRTKEDMPWSSRLQEEIWVSSNNQTFSARERGKDGVTWIFNDGEWIPSRSADVAIADEPERSSSEDTREDGDSNKNMSNNIEVSSNSSKIIGRNNNN